MTIEDYYALRWAVYVSYLPSGSISWGGLRGWGLYAQSPACCKTGFHRSRWTPIAGQALLSFM